MENCNMTMDYIRAYAAGMLERMTEEQLRAVYLFLTHMSRKG